MERIRLELVGQMLHSYRLEFIHPTTGEKMVLEAKIPEYFEKVLDLLKKGK